MFTAAVPQTFLVMELFWGKHSHASGLTLVDNFLVILRPCEDTKLDLRVLG